MRISGESGEYAALHHLRQVLFIPACLDRYSRSRQEPELRVSKSNLSSLYEELGHLSDSEREEREKLLTQKVALCNPFLPGYLQDFNTLAMKEGIARRAQAQSAKKALRAFELYERQKLDPLPSSAALDFGIPRVESALDHVPLVRSSIVDRALLDIAINRTDFIRRNVENILKISQGLAIYLAGNEASHVLNSDFYKVIACLINEGFIEEYGKRGLPVPAVTTDTINVIFQDSKERIEKGGQPNRILSNSRELLQAENPNILYAINLLAGIFRFDPTTTENAIYHFYSGWRSQAEADYWSRLSK